MLEANKSIFFERLFAVYNTNLLKRRFQSFQVKGLQTLLNKNPKLPLIIYCNHSSWWDGLVAFQISRQAGLNAFVMMEEKQLKNLFLFRLLGAFSVVRENPRAAMKSIRYAVKILKSAPENSLWIFPQGEILPNDLRPLLFFDGLAKIIEKVVECSAVSLSIRYEFMGEFKPHVFVQIGEPEIFTGGELPDTKTMTESLSRKLTDNLDLLKRDIINQNFNGFINLI